MGKEIADRLDGEITIVLVHKLRSPGNDELSIGAVDDTGWAYVSPYAKQLDASDAYIEAEKSHQLKLLKLRRQHYTDCAAAIDPMRRIVIVVDDGIATGDTMLAALHSIRAKKPSHLVCAVPVATASGIKKIATLADTIVCPNIPENFLSVGQFYEDFSQVDDAQVIRSLSNRADLFAGERNQRLHGIAGSLHG